MFSLISKVPFVFFPVVENVLTQIPHTVSQERTQVRDLGFKPPLSLISYKNFITCAKEINCFRMLLLVNLST